MAVAYDVEHDECIKTKTSLSDNMVKIALQKYACAEASHLILLLDEAENELRQAEIFTDCFFISGCFCQSAYDEDADGICTTANICSYCQADSKIEKLKRKILHIYELCRNFIKKNK